MAFRSSERMLRDSAENKLWFSNTLLLSIQLPRKRFQRARWEFHQSKHTGQTSQRYGPRLALREYSTLLINCAGVAGMTGRDFFRRVLSKRTRGPEGPQTRRGQALTLTDFCLNELRSPTQSGHFSWLIVEKYIAGLEPPCFHQFQF